MLQKHSITLIAPNLYMPSFLSQRQKKKKLYHRVYYLPKNTFLKKAPFTRTYTYIVPEAIPKRSPTYFMCTLTCTQLFLRNTLPLLLSW